MGEEKGDFSDGGMAHEALHDCTGTCGGTKRAQATEPCEDVLLNSKKRARTEVDGTGGASDDDETEELEAAACGGLPTVSEPVASAPLNPGLLAMPTSSRLDLLLNRVMGQAQGLPQLVIVDLDYTLWRGYVSDHLPPFEPHPQHADRVRCRGRVYAGVGGMKALQPFEAPSTMRVLSLFEEAREVLMAIKGWGARLAIASRAPDKHAADQVLSILGLGDLFINRQIYWGSGKTTHIRTILKASGANPHHILFFDDEAGNIKDGRNLGVSGHQVSRDSGLCWAALEKGVKQFRDDAVGRNRLVGFFAKAKK